MSAITWLSTDRIRIDTVANNSPNHTLTHTGTYINWDKVYPDQYLNFIRFNDWGGTAGGNDTHPAIGTSRRHRLPAGSGNALHNTLGRV